MTVVIVNEEMEVRVEVIVVVIVVMIADVCVCEEADGREEADEETKEQAAGQAKLYIL